jgi:hypothetical protein
MPRATYTYPIHPSVSLRLRASAVQVYSIRSMYCKRQVDLSLSRHLDHVKCLKDRFPRSRRDVGCNCPPACLSTRRPTPNFSTQWRVPLRPFVCDFSERTPLCHLDHVLATSIKDNLPTSSSFFNTSTSPFSSSLSVATPLRLFI